jgi:hypothetical protein
MTWDEDDRHYGRKVAYIVLGPRFPRAGDLIVSTAYLDDEVAPDVFVGTNKYTDAPLTVKWTGSRYEEIDGSGDD